ncbi:MAG: alginate export family protein [Woeseia sp.]
MKNGMRVLGAVCAVLLATPGVALLALDHGFAADARYRAESVLDDAFSERALASTLRLRLGYLSPAWQGWQAFAEFEGVLEVGRDRYNSTANNRTGFPVVADPQDTELNQAYLSRGIGDAVLRLGRQRINIANQRFIGSVEFRQNEQTFDAVMLRLPASGGSLQLGFISQVNRVYGAHHPHEVLAVTATRTLLIDYERRFAVVDVSTYAHLIELPDSPGASHQNIGIRVGAKHGRFDWRAEMASQDDYRGGSEGIDAGYHRVDLGWDFELIHLGVIREVLNGGGEYSFQTPFATLHAFNGVADKFARTPPGGLVDDAVELRGRYEGWEYGGSFHRFKADAGSVHYGNELAAFVVHPVGEGVTLRLEVADYSADSFEKDTLKVWLTLQARL